MSKAIRQYVGLFSAVLGYYVIHEGAHLIYALATGVFKQINIIGLGMQIDIFADQMSDVQLAAFCIVGSVATLIAAYTLILFANKIGTVDSKVFKACMYYFTIALLFCDPIYLSILCGYFGGGDMNGISLIVSEIVVRSIYGIIFIINMLLFIKIVLPKYKRAFQK